MSAAHHDIDDAMVSALFKILGEANANCFRTSLAQSRIEGDRGLYRLNSYCWFERKFVAGTLSHSIEKKLPIPEKEKQIDADIAKALRHLGLEGESDAPGWHFLVTSSLDPSTASVLLKDINPQEAIHVSLYLDPSLLLCGNFNDLFV